eukprot:38911-Chlamydomonas_euryale.AAC.2
MATAAVPSHDTVAELARLRARRAALERATGTAVPSSEVAQVGRGGGGLMAAGTATIQGMAARRSCEEDGQTGRACPVASAARREGAAGVCDSVGAPSGTRSCRRKVGE